MIQGRIFTSVSLGLGILFCTSLVLAQSNTIEKRQKLMKSNSAASKALKAAVADKDYGTIQSKAKVIAGNMDKLPALFPKGSTSDESRAKPAIWENWDQFTDAATTVKQRANELAEAAEGKDASQVQAKFKSLGQACGSCHKHFRAEKKK
ncbi:MAG TPA: cytochrome c [Terriglobales bacterium]|jgi:cytochrome c556|nr:cytochrome c [Terriglobales bacterium]